MNTQKIEKALKRLAASDTYLKRRNALRGFAQAVRELEGLVAQEYPKLRPDGSEIRPRRKRGAFCPACRVPMKSYTMLVRHILKCHIANLTCFCGKRFANRSKFAKHLANVPDLILHYSMARLKESAGVK